MKSDLIINLKNETNNIPSEIIAECSRLCMDLLMALDRYNGEEYDEVMVDDTEIRINIRYDGNIRLHAIRNDPDEFEMP